MLHLFLTIAFITLMHCKWINMKNVFLQIVLIFIKKKAWGFPKDKLIWTSEYFIERMGIILLAV